MQPNAVCTVIKLTHLYLEFLQVVHHYELCKWRKHDTWTPTDLVEDIQTKISSLSNIKHPASTALAV